MRRNKVLLLIQAETLFILERTEKPELEYLYPSRIVQWCDNSFHLKVVVKTIDSFLPANTTHLVPAKRNRSIKNIKAINPHSSSFQCPHHCVRRLHVLSKHACRQTITCSICPCNYFISVPSSVNQILLKQIPRIFRFCSIDCITILQMLLPFYSCGSLAIWTMIMKLVHLEESTTYLQNLFD